MTDVSTLGNIAENMEVVGADGELVGAVKLVWGGLTNLDSAVGSEAAASTGAPIETEPGVRDLPEGTSALGSAAAGYMEVEAVSPGVLKTIYVPLAHVAEIESDRVVLRTPAAEALGGVYDADPAPAG